MVWPWRMIPRTLLETILTNHAAHHMVPQPLHLHGPRGIGKTSLLLHRLLPQWNQPPHFTSYLNFSPPDPPFSLSASPPLNLAALSSLLHRSLESLVHRGIALGLIGAPDVLAALARFHGLHAALRRLTSSKPAPVPALWTRAVLSRTTPSSPSQIGSKLPREEAAYAREAAAALQVAKEVIELHNLWRREAVKELNRAGAFSRSLANSATDWPCLLLDLLSKAAQADFFQPKLILNNIDVLRKATTSDDSTVPAAMYHDSFIWRLVSLGVNERCLPIFLLTSDRLMQVSRSSFEDMVDAYLAYLKVTVVNPAMESALTILQKFASDARDGKIPEDRLHFGAPWRHLPRTNDPTAFLKWSKIQLMDFVQSLVNTEFGVNYLADYSVEILDDSSAVAMMEVGLLYAQRDPSFIRPITRGLSRKRCKNEPSRIYTIFMATNHTWPELSPFDERNRL